MADISKITLPNGSSYDIKDATARSGLAGKAAASHTHTKSQITDFPTIPTKTSQLTNDSGFKTTDNNTTYSLSKSGSTITLTGSDGSTTSVTDTDTNTWRGIQNNLTSDSTTDSLSAAQGKVLKGLVDGKAASSHGNHVPTTQTANNAVFLRNDNTWQTVTPANIGAAASSHTHSSYVNQNAFSNVVVGSTTVAADSATDTLTLVAGSNVTITPDATNDKITIAATNTWRGVQDNLTSTATDQSLSANQGKVLKGLVDGKAASSHTHDDRYYTESEIDTKLSGKANASHGKHVPDTCTTITDWNSATTTGWYMASGASNAPSSAWYFGYVIAHNTNYIVQEVYQFTASTDAKAIPKYIRAKMNGTWGSWAEVTVQKKVPTDAKFTDTVYTHPTSSGNKHIPSGGSSGQILRWSSDGTAVWGADNNTTYSAMTGATSSAAGSTGLVPAPAKGASNRYLRCDGTWQVPPDTNTTYTLAGLMGSSAKGSATQPVYWNGSAWTNTTYTLGKSVPSNAVFTDTNTHYTTHLYAGTSSGTANASTTNGNTYLILTDDSTARNRVKIAGSGATSVTSDASGNITISSTNTTYSAATTSANGLMTSAMVTKLNGIATGATKNSINTYDVSIAVADWATNSNGGYKCTKTVSGILATDEIFADVSLSSDVAAAKLQVAAWACVCNGNIFNSANNTVDFYCYDTKPSTALTIRLTVVR